MWQTEWESRVWLEPVSCTKRWFSHKVFPLRGEGHTNTHVHQHTHTHNQTHTNQQRDWLVCLCWNNHQAAVSAISGFLLVWQEGFFYWFVMKNLWWLLVVFVACTLWPWYRHPSDWLADVLRWYYRTIWSAATPAYDDNRDLQRPRFSPALFHASLVVDSILSVLFKLIKLTTNHIFILFVSSSFYNLYYTKVVCI